MMSWLDLRDPPAIIQPAPQGYDRRNGLLLPNARRAIRDCARPRGASLMLTPLVGFGAGGGGPELIFRSSAVSAASLTTYTFAAMAIGAASANRLVIALLFSHDGAGTAGDAPTSVTIGGVTATIHVSGVGTGANECSASVCSALVPTGTTADVVATWPDARTRAGCGVYTLTDYGSATPVATASAIDDPNTAVSVSLTVTAIQVGVVGSTSNPGASTTCTWTNATENFDSVMEAGFGSCSSAAVAAGFSGTVTATWANSGAVAIAGAVWG